MIHRRALAGVATGPLAAPAMAQAPQLRGPFWPGGARLAVGVCMMFEADGGQATQWQPGPPGTPGRFPNLPAIQQRSYGAIEGAPRLLDLFDRVEVRVSSFMIRETVQSHPELAREIVARGHEAGGRGIRHAPGGWRKADQRRARAGTRTGIGCTRCRRPPRGVSP